MALVDKPGVPVVGFFSFAPYPKPLPVGLVLTSRPLVAVKKKGPR